MKQTHYLLIATILVISCTKSPVEKDLHLYVKTPFRKGTIKIEKNGAAFDNSQILADSSRSYMFYNIQEGTAFAVTITRNPADTAFGKATLKWTFGNNQQVKEIYFDSIESSKTIDSYVAQE